MRIGKHESKDKKRLKPPPDYFSRGMQWRLLTIVALLMLVLYLATEARNPDRWKWLTNLDRLATDKQEEIDPRIKPPGDPSTEEVIVDQRSRPKSEDIEMPAERETLSANDRAWASGWEEVFDRLAYSDRTVVYELLKAAREKNEVDEVTTTAADEVLLRLDQEWYDYRSVALAGLKDLSEEEKKAWLPVLEDLELRWTVQTRPLLATIARREPLSDPQRTHLLGLQDLLDRLQLKAVQDNTPWRTSEREIWFRLLGKLQTQSPGELRQGSLGLVNYAQLFKQSDVYRGKLVTVRGTAEAVYTVDAPKNTYGIKHYWVYWLRPEGGPNSPVLVYALQKPAGFPSMELADLGRKKMPSMEDVEVTGFFFKRYAYQGQGGIFTTPMLLAREPKWLPSSFGSRRELPSAVFFFAVVALLALLATALAVWVYYQYRPGRARDLELPERLKIAP